jgi:hypothetical protein
MTLSSLPENKNLIAKIIDLAPTNSTICLVSMMVMVSQFFVVLLNEVELTVVHPLPWRFFLRVPQQTWERH